MGAQDVQGGIIFGHMIHMWGNHRHRVGGCIKQPFTLKQKHRPGVMGQLRSGFRFAALI